jgi:hypothetical protein
MAPPFLTLALDGGEWSASHPGHYNPGQRTLDTHWIEGWVGPRVGQDTIGKRKILTLPGIEPWPSSL